METPLGTLFENSGLIVDGKPVLKRIRNLRLTQIADLCQQASDISSYETVRSTPSIYSHTASLPLGGNPYPCHSLECRLNKVNKLAQFAALYSDKVYINNFFHGYEPHSFKEQKKDQIILDFTDELIIFSYLLPLLEAGKVQLVTFQGICPHCLSLKALDQNAKAEYERASKELQRKYYKELSYSLIYEEDTFKLTAHGPEILLPHGILYHHYENLKDLINMAPSLAEKVKTIGEVKLTPSEVKKIKAGKVFSQPIINSIAFELGGSHFLKTSYLCDSDLEVAFIRALSSDPIARRRTALMMNYLTCLVPFIDSVDISSLIRLRQHEQEAFILFRAALTKAIDEYKSHGHAFTERDAQAVYADIIQPRLATLDAKIRAAKRSFFKEGVRKVLSWAGSISVGIYTGIFTASPLAGAAAFGVTKAGAELLESGMAKSDVKETIKQDDMYFLWKVRELADVRTAEAVPYLHSQSQIMDF